MAVNSPTTPTPASTAVARTVSLSDAIHQLVQFDGPPEAFLGAMLQVQCKIMPAESAAILRRSPDRMDVLAVYPPLPQGATAPVWLAKVVEASVEVKTNEPLVLPYREATALYEAAPSKHMILLPLRSGAFTGLAAFIVNSSNQMVVARARERLELTVGLVNVYETRQSLVRRNVDIERLRQSMEVLASLNEHSRMRAAGMALVNEVASRWQGERVSLGFLQGRYVKLVAMSHTEKFTRKMKLVQDIESTMEECLDQDVEIVYPASTRASYVSRAAADLSNRHGPTAILSLPLRRDGKVVAVLTIERAVNKPFTLDEVETLRLMCDLCSARLAELHESDRWFGVKIARTARKGLAFVVGSEHTWIKLLVLAIVGFLAFAIFVKGSDRVDATFTIEATEKHVITAPFTAKLDTVNFEPGDWVLTRASVLRVESALSMSGQALTLMPFAGLSLDPYLNRMKEDVRSRSILATLDTTELSLRRANLTAEKSSYRIEADEALRDGKKAAEQIALAKVEKMDAQIALIDYQVKQAVIHASIDGIVLTGELKRQVGTVVEPKTQLFEIAPLTSLRAELAIPEDRIADVMPNAGGELSLAARPGTYLPFQLVKVHPVALVVDQQNVFKAEATLNDTEVLREGIQNEWLKIGSKGVARIDVGERAYGYLWTRNLVNWIRMKLWF
ncbi:MAG: HlyD family efflux transporter periplasmic adaptor subunit [Phycisphaeraceae bacterium]